MKTAKTLSRTQQDSVVDSIEPLLQLSQLYPLVLEECRPQREEALRSEVVEESIPGLI